MFLGPRAWEGRRERRSALPFLLPVSALCLATLTLTPARADVSLRLNSAGVVSAPTTLTVDGIITSTGDWRDLKGAQVCITYDPAKVSLSNATAAPGWSYEIAADHADTHVFQALFTTQAVSLTATGPIFSFTVTPVAGPVDTSDCSILRLRGGNGQELSPVCELVSGEFYSVWIQDTCPDQIGQYLADNDPSHQQDRDEHKDSTGGLDGTGGVLARDTVNDPGKGDVDANGHVDILDAVHAIRIFARGDQATSTELALADVSPTTATSTGDGLITLEDATLILRIAGGLALIPDTPASPYDLRVAATGKDDQDNLKVTLYWKGLASASQYYVYRGTQSGGEDYDQPIATITETPGNHSYLGSPYLWYTDAEASKQEGATYYYTVRAEVDGQMSGPSAETQVIATSSGVPWDTRTPSLIGPVFTAQFDLRYPVGSTIRIVGPDETIYDSTSGTALPPEGTYNPATNTYTLSTGESFSLPGLTSDASEFQMRKGPEPAPSKGPYRIVKSVKGYTGISTDIYLPSDTSIYIPTPTDTGYVYIGSAGVAEIDAGLQYSATNHNWALFLSHFTSKTGRTFVADPRRISIFGPFPVHMEYYAAKIPQAGSFLTVSAYDPTTRVTSIRSIGTFAGMQPQEQIQMKRIVAIAQPGMGVVPTGAVFGGDGYGVRFYNPNLIDEYSDPTLWETSQKVQEGNYTGAGKAEIDFSGPIHDESNIGIIILPPS